MKIQNFFKKVVDIISKVRANKWIFRSLLFSIYFNFRYLPIKQAIKLPILLYKPHFLCCKGKIIIDSPSIKTGMICLGRFCVALYPNNGFTFENHGGCIIFKGRCSIGNNSVISVGHKGKIVFGENFIATTTLKLVSFHFIKFGNDVLCGWDCLFSDTDFHRLTLIDEKEFLRAFGKIEIGNNCWFAMRNIILKNTYVPENCVIAANSLLNKQYKESYVLLAGQPANVKRKGVYRDKSNDNVDY